MRFGLVLVLAALLPAAATAQEKQYWRIEPDGGLAREVTKGEAFQDHIEMSGLRVSLILTYGVVESGRLMLSRHIVFPGLRTVPNDTHASLSYTFAGDATPRVFLNGRPAAETAILFHHRGLASIEARIGDVLLTVTIFPSATNPAAFERYAFTNRGKDPATVELEDTRKTVRTTPDRGVSGAYVITSEVREPGPRRLAPGASTTFDVIFTAREETASAPEFRPADEEQARRARIEQFLSELRLETPDPVLNTAFAFAKIRTTESIYRTKGGLMHGPGGGAYYAAIWANDQAEYANPFFPFLGDSTANESALNAYRLFARYMNADFKPIPSSIIAEGTGFWNGAGDRGDMAMIAYGAARFALARGDRKIAEELWPLISWCLEYCRRKRTADGVIASDSDELEGRFPAGKANLSTSSLYYDALHSAEFLARELKRPDSEWRDYAREATDLRSAMNRYFGATVGGYDTWRYYDGNTVLRAWICVPLTMGLFDRRQGTIDALFSPALWTPDGLATQSGEKTFWDRATLYALRGVLAAGETQRAMDFLTRYSTRRLLGAHVPYPVEAWPEGNQRHLAAESALYCRIFTEGLFGIRPTGLRSFSVQPRLPAGWDRMALRRVHAFGGLFDLVVTRSPKGLLIEVLRNGSAIFSRQLADGLPADVNLPN
jgi:hypothetical protein